MRVGRTIFLKMLSRKTTNKNNWVIYLLAYFYTPEYYSLWLNEIFIAKGIVKNTLICIIHLPYPCLQKYNEMNNEIKFWKEGKERQPRKIISLMNYNKSGCHHFSHPISTIIITLLQWRRQRRRALHYIWFNRGTVVEQFGHIYKMYV